MCLETSKTGELFYLGVGWRLGVCEGCIEDGGGSLESSDRD